MTVRELIEELQKLDPDLTVYHGEEEKTVRKVGEYGMPTREHFKTDEEWYFFMDGSEVSPGEIYVAFE